jgi:hypothetical protein
LAVALLGALTHQSVAVLWPARSKQTFVSSFRSVSAMSYTNAVVVLFLLTAILGGVIYPTYRITVRPMLEDYRMFAANGTFELKEHFVAVGAALLPAYWHYWHKPQAEEKQLARAALTTLLAAITWWGFIVGHVLNNIRGFGS